MTPCNNVPHPSNQKSEAGEADTAVAEQSADGIKRAPPDALAGANTALGRLEVVETHCRSPFVPLVDDGHEVRDLVHHPTHHRCVLALDHLVDPPQAEPPDALALDPGAADDAGDHLDLDGPLVWLFFAFAISSSLPRPTAPRPAPPERPPSSLPLHGPQDVGDLAAPQLRHPLGLLQPEQSRRRSPSPRCARGGCRGSSSGCSGCRPP